MSKKINILVFLIIILLAVLTGCSNNASTVTTAETKTWTPTKEFQFIVPMSAGGGSDIFARTIAKIAENYCSSPIIVINKPGGSSAIGFSYVANQKGDPYTISLISSSFFTGPLGGKSPVSYKDFTPIAGMAYDPSCVVVKADSKYNSLSDLLKDAKDNPDKLSFAGVGGLTDDTILFAAMTDKAGVKLKYVPFQSGGESATAVLGGHVDAAFMNPAEANAQIQAGKLKPLAVALDKRLEGFPSVPTFKEDGVDISLAQFRGVVAPKDIPEEVVVYLSDLMKKVSEDPAWQEQYLKNNFIQGEYLDYKACAQKVEQVNEMYKKYIGQVDKLQK